VIDLGGIANIVVWLALGLIPRLTAIDGGPAIAGHAVRFVVSLVMEAGLTRA
jgi:hypothetical protein